jgi:hypothetical protein
MAKPNEPYHYVVLESFIPTSSSGHRGKVELRPVPGQIFGTHLLSESPRAMVDTSVYLPGTKFRIKAKLTDREGGGEFLYSHWSWQFEVIELAKK